MKKSIFLVFLLSFGFLSVQGQSTDSNSRVVKDNVLISKRLPEIELKVSDEFEYIGSFYFEIFANSEEYDEDVRGKAVAAGDRFVFANVDDKKVKKLFIIQLEGFLPEFDFTYNYSFKSAEFIGDNKYRHNTWFYNSKELAEQNPKGEGALTRKFLEEKGYQIADEYMMSRFVGLASKDRKNEIIIFYIEMMKESTGYTLDQYENAIKDEEKKEIRNALIERSHKSFTITKG